MEICLDVGSSSIATASVNLVVSHAEALVVDLGFVLQGDRENELPEKLLCAQCARALSFKAAVPLHYCYAAQNMKAAEEHSTGNVSTRPELQADEEEEEEPKKDDWMGSLARSPFACG
eukprot:FR744229.1.p1 GENE.FR744229.1~~FR744229.1.p1  ORF type:complete len:125 (+),score=16.53 FR744229.1:24-377(+)